MLAICVFLSVVLMGGVGQGLENPKTCVVSFLDNGTEFEDATRKGKMYLGAELNNEIRRKSNELIRKLGYDDPWRRYEFHSGGLSKLRDCLTQDYEEVILISQVEQVVEGYPAILYFGYFETQDGATVNQKMYVPDRFFKKVSYHPNLREITLVLCGGETVRDDQYLTLHRLPETHGIHVRLAPNSIFIDMILRGGGYRHFSVAAYLIAEAAQDLDQDSLKCFFRSSTGGVGIDMAGYGISLDASNGRFPIDLDVGKGMREEGASRCVRNHFDVKLKTYADLGGKISTRWISFQSPKDDMEVSNSWNLLTLERGIRKGFYLPIPFFDLRTGSVYETLSFIPVSAGLLERVEARRVVEP